MQSQTVNRIVLGCRKDFHSGFHPRLQACPPRGVEFQARDATHAFLFPEGARGSPHAEFHFGEFLDFGPDPGRVHSVTWPVLNCASWIVDMDDFGYPTLVGRHAHDLSFQASFGQAWPRDLEAAIRTRFRNMMAAYTHRSCRAVLFWTRNAARTVRDWTEVFDCPHQAELLLAKSHVVFPAFPAAPAGKVSRKWSAVSPLRIVFCGRDFHEKNGALALRVLGRIARDCKDRAHCTYVGHIPESSSRRHREDLLHIVHHPALPHGEMLSLLENSHVLFHPSKSESLGLVMIESAACGLAVVAAKGRLLEHMEELFDSRSALLVDRDAIGADEEEGLFEQFLLQLVKDPKRAEVMGRLNHDFATRGHLSLKKRDEVLKAAYSRTADGISCPGLTLDDLPCSAGNRPVLLSKEEIAADLRSLLGKRNTQQRYFVLEKSL